MSDILAMDYSILSSSLTDDEISLLKQYQTLAINLTNVKSKLDEINAQISTVDESNVINLTNLAIDLQKALGVLGTAFKSTVHNVLLHVDSNQINNISNNDSLNINYKEEALKSVRRAELERELKSPEKENVNQIITDDDLYNDKIDQQIENTNTNTNVNVNLNVNHQQNVVPNNIQDDEINEDEEEEDDDVDLGSGIDEETMNAVDRIQHELGISTDDVDIHRQIADQLEIENTEDY
jgi:hypothetical protein